MEKHHHELNKIGPGSWYSLHLIASKAQTISMKQTFLSVLSIFKESFFCPFCKQHLNEYILKDPPSSYLSVENGLFKWTVNAHNNVNKMNDKNILSYNDAYDLYFGEGSTCTIGCGHDNIIPPKPLGERISTPKNNNIFSISYIIPTSPAPIGFI